VAYTCWLAAHRPHDRMDVVSMHPGVIATPLLHAMFDIGGDSPEYAAANVVHVVGLHGDNGTYYDEQEPADPNPEAVDPAIEKALIDITEKLIH
jgi:hypothetical protein